MTGLRTCHQAAGALAFLTLASIGAPEAHAQAMKTYDFDDAHRSLKSISVPASWLRSEEMVAGRVFVITFAPSTGVKYQISVAADIRRAIASTSEQAVRDVFDANAGIDGPVALAPAQIVAIKDEFGNLGDNQFTNSNPWPGSRSPAFRIATAHIVSVNGKVVVKIDGSFVDDSGQSRTFVSCVFTPSDMGIRRTMLSICAESKEATEFATLRNVFATALNTIVWRK